MLSTWEDVKVSGCTLIQMDPNPEGKLRVDKDCMHLSLLGTPDYPVSSAAPGDGFIGRDK